MIFKSVLFKKMCLDLLKCAGTLSGHKFWQYFEHLYLKNEKSDKKQKYVFKKRGQFYI